MTTISDIVDGELSHDESGYKDQRTFIVSNLSGDAITKKYSASIAPGIPQRGDPHPAIPGIIVTSITVSIEGPDTYRVQVSYGAPTYERREPDEDPVNNPPVLQISTTLQGATTAKDIDGDQLFVDFVDDNGNQFTQSGEVELQIPFSMISIQRKERYTPLYKSLEFSGSVNKNAIGDFAPRTLLIDISGDTDDGGLSYNVTYNVQYNPRTWDAEIFFKDEETDRIHEDVNIRNGNGYKRVRVYPEKDFNRLGLNFNFTGVPNNGFSFLAQ